MPTLHLKQKGFIDFPKLVSFPSLTDSIEMENPNKAGINWVSTHLSDNTSTSVKEKFMDKIFPLVIYFSEIFSMDGSC